MKQFTFLITSILFCKDFNSFNRQSFIYIFHTLYWITRQLMFLYIYLISMRSISDIVYLLPLLFSPIANLGQLYATSHSHLTVWLLLCAKQQCQQNERCFVVEICSMIPLQHVQLDLRWLPHKICLDISFETMNSREVMAQQRNTSDVLYYAALLNIIKKKLVLCPFLWCCVVC